MKKISQLLLPFLLIWCFNTFSQIRTPYYVLSDSSDAITKFEQKYLKTTSIDTSVVIDSIYFVQNSPYDSNYSFCKMIVLFKNTSNQKQNLHEYINQADKAIKMPLHLHLQVENNDSTHFSDYPIFFSGAIPFTKKEARKEQRFLLKLNNFQFENIEIEPNEVLKREYNIPKLIYFDCVDSDDKLSISYGYAVLSETSPNTSSIRNVILSEYKCDCIY